MKRFILCISCLLICCLFLFPEVQAAIPDTGNWISHHLLTSDGLTVLAAGPAFAPLKWNIGQNNMGGYKGRLLFIPYDAPSTVPMIPVKPTTNEDPITASGSFTFPSGGTYTQPIYLYSTKGKVGYKAEIQGETDGKSFKQTLEFFFPGNTPGMHAFSTLVKNTPGYFVFEDSDGQQFPMGKPGMYADVSPSFDGGKLAADQRGTAYTATCDANESAVVLGTPIDMEVIAGLKPAPSPGG
ncbi:hypothetical protein NXV85_11430 [Bacteroides fragilis]|nr:hypothetical protein [Bacteroides fragilis]